MLGLQCELPPMDYGCASTLSSSYACVRFSSQPREANVVKVTQDGRYVRSFSIHTTLLFHTGSEFPRATDGEPSLFSARSEVRCAQTTGIQSCKCGQSLPAQPSSAQRLRVITGVCNAHFRSPNSSSSCVCMGMVHVHVYVDICMCAYRGVCTYLHMHMVASGSLHTWLWRQHLPRNMEIIELASGGGCQ